MALAQQSSFRLAVVLRFLATGSGLLTGFISLKFYGWFLDPASVGVVITALQILGYIPYLNLGFRTSINQRLLAGAGTAEEEVLLRMSQVFYSYLALFVMAGSLGAMLCYSWLPIAKGSGQPLSFFLAVGFSGGASFYATTQTALLVGLQAQQVVFLLTALQSWASLVALLWALNRGWTVWAFPFSTLIGIAASLPLALIAIRRLKPEVRFFQVRVPADFWPFMQRLRGAALACFRSESSIMLLFTIDVVLAGLIWGPAKGAIYAVLAQLFTRLRAFLQTFGEAAWPIIALKGLRNDEWSNPLLRLNAWIYGSILGALAATLAPITVVLLAKSWTPAPALVWLMILRNLIGGVWSAAGFFMLGLGQYATLSKYVERELALSIVLAAPLGWFFGLDGLALAFLLGTAAGTGGPLLVQYAKCAKAPVSAILLQIWPRAIISFGVSFWTAQLLLSRFGRGWLILAVFGAASCAGLGLAFFWAAARSALRSGREVSLRGLVRQC